MSRSLHKDFLIIGLKEIYLTILLTFFYKFSVVCIEGLENNVARLLIQCHELTLIEQQILMRGIISTKKWHQLHTKEWVSTWRVFFFVFFYIESIYNLPRSWGSLFVIASQYPPGETLELILFNLWVSLWPFTLHTPHPHAQGGE